MTTRSVAWPLDQLLLELPALFGKHQRFQWSFVPYSETATLIVHEDVEDTASLIPTGPDPGCWSETFSTQECVDVSYRVLTDSKRGFDERLLYRYHILAITPPGTKLLTELCATF